MTKIQSFFEWFVCRETLIFPDFKKSLFTNGLSDFAKNDVWQMFVRN